MTDVRVGDVYETNGYRLVVTLIDHLWFEGVFNDGETTTGFTNEDLRFYEFLKHYDTFNEAIASREFKGENS